MEGGALSDSSVTDLLQQMDRYVVDYSARANREAELLQAHDVRGLPSLIFFNAAGEESGRVIGGRSASEVAAVARRALSR